MNRRERGLEVYAAQLGVTPAEAERQFVETYGSLFAEEAFASAGGSTWDGSPLSRRDRSLVVLAVLAAQGGVEPRLRTHVGFALKNGATVDELEATLALLAVYAGFPRASVAMEVVRDELERLGAR
jgi:alkylhydroperoxidase/carboxymuconolactone decarboxylase family protein YurZ